MFSKYILPLIVLIILLAGIAFVFNSINEENLLKQQVIKVFSDLLHPQKKQFMTKLTSELAPDVDLQEFARETVTVTLTLAPTKIPTPVDPYGNDPELKDAQWGKAVQVSETGYRMKVGYDNVMATPQETFQALNLYRQTKGKSSLTWDDRLAKYGLERATFVCKNGSDGHAGFSDYVEKQKGYKTLGFYSLGENMSTHMKFTGTHLIEWMYAGDEAHDSNQLGDWSHVGVGIFEDCSSLIFGNNMI